VIAADLFFVVLMIRAHDSTRLFQIWLVVAVNRVFNRAISLHREYPQGEKLPNALILGWLILLV